ncbi:zinc finger protein 227-like [Sitodiplosis mosellana]|uniref:zinc finger protein 227-like n=1 Tax=Sitodiplosis mosellana TaxID=263140 RepID=UPI002444927F|nr:zinc finger protein 227-like [Sitodiplosis mosellana]
MCFTIGQIERACGLLVLTEFNTFVYCCKNCQCEFESGPNLEVHILSEHQDDKGAVFVNGNVLVDNCSFEPTPIELDASKVKIEQFESNVEESDVLNVEESCVEYAKPFSVSLANAHFDIGCNSVEKTNKTIVSFHQEQPQDAVNSEEKMILVANGTVEIESVGHSSLQTAHDVSMPQKRSRGRPPGLKRQKIEVKPHKPRGRPAGTKNKQTIINEAIKAMTPKRSVGRPPNTLEMSNRRFYCDMCADISFKYKQGLLRHMTLRHIRPPGTENPIEKLENSNQRFYCDMCPELSFKQKTGMKKHMTRRHIRKDIAEKLKQCEICHKFPRISYEHHMKIKHSELQFKCDICDAVFRQNTSRVIHMRKHTGEKPYLCSICGKAFASNMRRFIHERGVHSTVHKHPCSYCEKTFDTRQRLQDHVNAIHTKIRPYSCDVCNKNFSTKDSLRIHKASHGEAKLKCRYCETAFKTRTSRWRHEMVYHRKVVMVDGKFMNMYKKSDRMKMEMLTKKDQGYSLAFPMENKQSSTKHHKPIDKKHQKSKLNVGKINIRLKERHKAGKNSLFHLNPLDGLIFVDTRTKFRLKMCFTIDQIERACGLLVLTEFNTFVYCCKSCQCEFESGSNLEVHILSEHQDDMETIFENSEVFVESFNPYASNPAISEYGIWPTNVKVEQTDVEELNESKLLQSSEAYVEESSNDDTPLADLLGNHGIDNVNSSDESIKANDELSIVKKRRGQPVGWRQRRYSDEAFTPEKKKAGTKRAPGRPPGAKNKNYDDALETKYAINDDAKPRIKRAGRPTTGQFYCEMCPDLTFDGKMNLTRHMHRCHVLQKRKCEICNKITRKGYERHMKKCHPKEAGRKQRISRPVGSKNRNYARDDIKNYHIIDNKVESMTKRGGRPTIGIFYCEMCPDLTFDGKMNLKKHMFRCHILQKWCKICKYRPRQSYERHMLKHHPNQPHTCHICNAIFKGQPSLKAHLRLHTGEKPYLCATCGKSFTTHALYRNHEVRVHRNIRKYKCQHCSSSFHVRYRLQDHMNAFHTMEKPHQCDICGKGFASRTYARIHRITHGEKELQCRYCDKMFKLAGNRLKHETSMHNIVITYTKTGN